MNAQHLTNLEIHHMLIDYDMHRDRYQKVLSLIVLADTVGIHECELNMLCARLQALRSHLETIENILEARTNQNES